MRGDQAGFTLLEMLVAIAVAGVIAPLVTSAIYQITAGTETIDQRTVALADIDNAASWISLDLSLAQDLLDPVTLNPLVSCATGTQPSIRAQWTDQTFWGQSSPAHVAEYSIEPGTTRLQRNYDGFVSIVGRYISDLSLCLDAQGIVRFDIASTVEGRTPFTKALHLQVSPRGSVQ